MQGDKLASDNYSWCLLSQVNLLRMAVKRAWSQRGVKTVVHIAL